MELRALARQHTHAALDALVKALDNERTSVAAATALLDRGYGKPVQEIAGEGGGAVQIFVGTGIDRAVE